MSGGSSDSYRSTFRDVKSSYVGSDDEKKSAASKRKERIDTFRTRAESDEPPKPRPTRNTEKLYEEDLVKKRITKPAPGVKRIHIFLVDNTGSNRVIAEHLKTSTGYLVGAMNNIDPEAQFATIYFGDHGDGNRMIQEIDYIFPNQEGEKILYSTIRHTSGVNGYDEPEAIECVLKHACELNFGEAEERHLYLVTDVVAHDMGMEEDDGCPFQVSWRKSVKKVNEVFTSFTVIGCGVDKEIGELQKQFLAPDREAFDLIDLSSIHAQRHRLAITGNALLFLVARHTGLQGVEMFLSFLYEKWLADPIFGKETDLRAREAILRFSKYIEAPKEVIDEMMEKVLS